jgi:hypothetical protein
MKLQGKKGYLLIEVKVYQYLGGPEIEKERGR